MFHLKAPTSLSPCPTLRPQSFAYFCVWFSAESSSPSVTHTFHIMGRTTTKKMIGAVNRTQGRTRGSQPIASRVAELLWETVMVVIMAGTTYLRRQSGRSQVKPHHPQRYLRLQTRGLEHCFLLALFLTMAVLLGFSLYPRPAITL